MRTFIDLDTGALDTPGLSFDWTMHDAHPDTHTPFGGAVIPEFARLRTFCTRQHDSAPVTGLIGWDVTLDADLNPVLIEFNKGRATIKVPETVKGPSFRGLGFEDVWKAQADR